MNVMLISQCSKKALTETRRILDQFAERRGDRSWQTAITQQGLQTLHRLLRQTARKNTAVACHWIRSKDHSELIWVVGDARQFNAQGATPTNMTARDVLRAGDENDWHSAEEIRLFASLAALFHDFGKASNAFQNKLKPSARPTADAYRHEWISLRLFEAFVSSDKDEEWLTRLASLSNEQNDSNKNAWSQPLRDGIDKRLSSPFDKLPPLARAVGWLIVSHHRIPTPPKDLKLRTEALKRLPEDIEADWCGSRSSAGFDEIEACWRFGKGLPFKSRHWRAHASKIARAILQRPGLLNGTWLDDPYVLHLSRLALMLADHYYSSEPSHARYGDPGFDLYANTDRRTGERKQRLDEHLIGVEVNAGRIMAALPRMARQLPSIARHKGFRLRSKDTHYRWQDRAFDVAESLQARSVTQGFFGVNMASTGCGKTLANGRILYALSDPNLGTRFVIALGLRTLTLQTGDVYRERLGLGPEDLGVLVGGGAVRALHEHQRKEEAEAAILARIGAESSANLLPEHNYVHFEGSLEDGPLNRWLRTSPGASSLLNAPILACTIDHLMPATEGTRGGHQILPMLRLMSSDLVLDEPDDFGNDDLPALCRLVNWAGMLGSRVLLSSATLPPALIQGLFLAYLEGRRHFQHNRGVPGYTANICCAWFDEFSSEASEQADGNGYSLAHQSYVKKRLTRLAAATVRRSAEIKPLLIAYGQQQTAVCAELAAYLKVQLHALHHSHNTTDQQTGKRASFGLIRLANIDPLVEVARALFALGAEVDHHIHLCVYHSQHPLLIRSSIERRLDKLLNRKQPEAIFHDIQLRERLNGALENNHIFVVLATAVAEVGRDHDYDWAIVEPSSMRSIIQLAGRIRRHRPEAYEVPNLYLLDTNIRHLVHGKNELAFIRPGFESKYFSLKNHRLSELLTLDQLTTINSSSRIQEREAMQPDSNLADLEHACLHDLILGAPTGKVQAALPANLWWTTRAYFAGELQQRQQFRHDPVGRQRYGLLPDEDGEIGFYRFEPDWPPTPVENLRHTVDLQLGPRIGHWGATDYEEALNELADGLQLEISACAKNYGTVDLPKDVEQGWLYHQTLGFSRFR
ncbi:type I-F CRISPR-associated helicase Cas3f [Nitrosovibrio sp. Nv4]|uniref:type I-F CRISPR-associated helicase Cas3f n=1 Tax=Nitrosovibrio sp. Nv4 TaxID=1945880 RepID=UPI000BDDA14D|nr:type I-F CRISPR-associated helicase Cas3f [Nitrosovibrio sp. Nv4]SOD41652.1 CRISPR-associated helicase, Cas3 family [Nitrosovibrio sp. Nv4]